MIPGCEQLDENGASQVIRRLKSLYGLRQSLTNWWNMIDKHLIEIGFKRLKSDLASTPTRSAVPFIS